jgi:hypothetical protein
MVANSIQCAVRHGLGRGREALGLGITLPLSIIAILALFSWRRRGWRRRMVSYAGGHERCGVASMPKRGVGV